MHAACRLQARLLPCWPSRPLHLLACRVKAPAHWARSATGGADPAPAATAAGAELLDALSPTQRLQVERYLDELMEWNQVMDLTAVTDRHGAVERHILDSLALLPVLDDCMRQQQWSSSSSESGPARNSAAGAKQHEQQGSSSCSSVVDVGSGAGLPGLVLAIVRPQWHVVLLDSLQKRCRFLEHAALAAGLSNVSVKWARAEDAGQSPELREQFDVAVARAVAQTRLLAELCLPLVRVGGHWVAAKGPSPEREVTEAANALGQLGGGWPEVRGVASWSADGQRTAVVVRKEKTTPAKFPRKPGVPAKRPL